MLDVHKKTLENAQKIKEALATTARPKFYTMHVFNFFREDYHERLTNKRRE